MTMDNPKWLKGRPSKIKDPDWMQNYREWWNRSIIEGKKCREQSIQPTTSENSDGSHV